MPPGDVDYPMPWMLIKAGFSRRLPKGERINASRRGKGERGIWQRRHKEVLGQPLPWLEGIASAKRPERLPVVLTREEVESILAHLGH